MLFFILAIASLAFIVNSGEGELDELIMGVFCGTVMIATGLSEDLQLSVRIAAGVTVSTIAALIVQNMKQRGINGVNWNDSK